MSDEDKNVELVGPREHHYAFAHKALPSWFFEDTIRLVEALSADEDRTLLRELWDHVGEGIDVSERLSPDGLDCEIRVVGDVLIAVVSLPVPDRMPEAYFVAGLLRRVGGSEPEGTDGGDNPDMSVRVFTLELTDPTQNASDAYIELLRSTQWGGPHAVLCEWTREGSHLNFGGPVPPTVDDFISAALAKAAEDPRKA